MIRKLPRTFWLPASGTTPGTTVGGVATATGTVSTLFVSGTTFASQRRATRFTNSSSAPAGLVIDGGAGATYAIGAPPGGGIALYAEFSLALNNASTRMFVGLSAAAPLIASADPSAAADTIGVGFDASVATTDSLHLISRGAGGGTNNNIRLGTATPSLKVGGNAPRAGAKAYSLFIYGPPQAETKGYLVVLYNLTDKALAFWNVVTTNLPRDASALRVYAQVRHATSGSAALDLRALQLDTSFDGVFDPTDLGASGTGLDGTPNGDDYPALQAALWAASSFYTSGASPLGGGAVRIPPGIYGMSQPLGVVGAVDLAGNQGSGPDGGVVLQFDKDVGAGTVEDPASGGCVVVHGWGKVEGSVEEMGTYPFPVWLPDHVYTAGEIVVPPLGEQNAHYYRCITGGQSGGAAPLWNNATAWGAQLADNTVTWMGCGQLPSGNGAVIRNLGVVQLPGGRADRLCHGIALHRSARLESVYVSRVQGDGIHVYGSFQDYPPTGCNGWSIGGLTTVSECGRHGLFVGGQDANSGGTSGTFQAINCGSYALYQEEPTGNAYGMIGGEGNGIKVVDVMGVPTWSTSGGDTTINARTWAPFTDYSEGDLVLPPPATPTGFQYVVTVSGASTAAEPAWPTVVGDFVELDGVRYTCLMEEGGTVRLKGPTITSIAHIHGETDQPGADFDGGSVLLSANSVHKLTLRSQVLWGMSAGVLMPFTIYTRGQNLPAEVDPVRLVRVDIGSLSAGEVAIRFSADEQRQWAAGVWIPDKGFVQKKWDPTNPSYARWREQWGELSETGLSYTQSGGASLPQPGAICFPNYWLGAQLGLEARHGAMNPTGFRVDEGPYFPDLFGNGVQAWGSWGPGDVVFNLCGQLGGTELPMWPFAWRPRRYGAKRQDDTIVWAQDSDYTAGTLIKPVNNNPSGYLFRAEWYGWTTPNGVNEPNWAALALGDVVDEVGVVGGGKRPMRWRCMGVELNVDAGGSGFWDFIITQSPTLTSVDVDAVGATLVMSPDDAAYERVKLVGVVSTAALTLVMPNGASGGFTRFIWNGSLRTITVQMAGGGGGTTVVIMPGTAANVGSDGVNCIRST